jgi:hypothetical protein
MATFSQLPGTLNLAWKKGDRFATALDFDLDLTGYTVTSSIVSLVTGSDVVSFNVNVTNPGAGQVTIDLTETQSALPVGTYGWELHWGSDAHPFRTPVAGIVEVK